MAEPHWLYALTEKRAELAGKLEAAEAEADQLRADLMHIDRTIQIMRPDYKPEGIGPKRKHEVQAWFSRGEMQRMIGETLRAADTALTAKEIALAIMEAKCIDAGDQKAVRLLEKRVWAFVDRRSGSLFKRVEYGPKAIGWRV